MKVELNYIFTDEEISNALYKFKQGKELDVFDNLAIVYGAAQWVNFKEECKADPSYRWGYGHTYR